MRRLSGCDGISRQVSQTASDSVESPGQSPGIAAIRRRPRRDRRLVSLGRCTRSPPRPSPGRARWARRAGRPTGRAWPGSTRSGAGSTSWSRPRTARRRRWSSPPEFPVTPLGAYGGGGYCWATDDAARLRRRRRPPPGDPGGRGTGQACCRARAAPPRRRSRPGATASRSCSNATTRATSRSVPLDGSAWPRRVSHADYAWDPAWSHDGARARLARVGPAEHAVGRVAHRGRARRRAAARRRRR